MPRHWPYHPTRPVVAAVVFRDDAPRRPGAAGPDHTPVSATLCLSCGHTRQVRVPAYVVARMRARGARCTECPVDPTRTSQPKPRRTP